MYSVAIIGAGFSGVLTTFHLQRLRPDIKIYLIESDSQREGKGVAYSTGDKSHLLNVPAGKMSALSDNPNHFLNWLATNNYSFQPDDFVPRKTYGDYIRSILNEVKENITFINYEAISIAQNTTGLSVELSSGQSIYCDKVLLALGNFPPSSIDQINDEIKNHRNYFSDPWHTSVFKDLDTRENIFIIGTGLTMVDMAMSLQNFSHLGHIRVISTHGFLPQVHQKYSPYPDFYDDLKNSNSVNSLTIKLHRHIARAARSGINWRAVIDAIRPHTQELWQQLSIKEKEEFMDKVRHIWGVARHRIPPESNEVLTRMIREGQLIIKAARLHKVTMQQEKFLIDYKIRNTQQQETFIADRIINCTGPESNYKKLESPLIKQMLAQGLIQCDPLRLGIYATPEGYVLDKNNMPSKNIFTIGPCMKGILWECTAVPELRYQTLSVARRLCH